MSEIKIKSNGLRNELKEIRKSIDKLTEAIVSQTNKRYESNSNIGSCTNKLCKCKKNQDGTV
jgi:chorismate mutase